MASVNLTCTLCGARSQCERCRSITRELRAAGHTVTPSSRYDALRMATVGAYGFDACILPIQPDEPSIIDAAVALLSRTKVGVVIDPALIGGRSLPVTFRVIDVAHVGRGAFPVDWIVTPVPIAADPHPTRQLEIHPPAQADVQTAHRRLKTVARRAQRELGAAGFAGEARLDLLAALEDEIAWAAASGSSFGLVLLHTTHAGNATAADMEASLAQLRAQLARIIRSQDLVAQGTDSLLVIVSDAGPDDASVAATRVKKSLRRAQKDAKNATVSSRLSVGSAAYPAHGTTRAALLAHAMASAAPL